MCEAKQLDCTIRLGQELPAGQPGKQTLLSHFEFLRRKSSLLIDAFGKRTVSVFFIDKDIDDGTRCKRRSPHVIYTAPYNVENYIYCHGDLVSSVAAAASLDLPSVVKQLPKPDAWRARVRREYKDRIVLCILAHILRAPFGPNFTARRSLINDPNHGGVDPVHRSKILNGIRGRSKLSRAEFDAALSRVARRVNSLDAKGRLDEVFQGKWYASLLSAEAAAAAAGRAYDADGLEKRLARHVAQTIEFAGPWSAKLRSALASVPSSL